MTKNKFTGIVWNEINSLERIKKMNSYIADYPKNPGKSNI